jgi:ketosteroid isomerase-like protein
MNSIDPKLTVQKFNACINSHNVDGLAEFMTDDVIMKDENSIVVKGKEAFKNAWVQFFDMCPDYRNHFTRIESQKNLVIIVGSSTCSNNMVNGPALWTARVENGLIAEWRILEDTEANRKRLGL